MKTLLSIIVAALTAIAVTAAPHIYLVSGTLLEENFRNDGVILDKWVLDNDRLIVQAESNQTVQTQIVFPKMSGNPIRIIRREKRVKYNGAAFVPVSGEEIRLWGIESVTRSWIADTNEIPLVKMGLTTSLNGNVGKRVILKGKYAKFAQLQKSLYMIDNTLDDRDWIIRFKFVADIGGGTNVFPVLTVPILAGERKRYSPSLTDGSKAVKRPLTWMSYYDIEGEMVP